MTIESAVLDKILDGTKKNLIIWYKDKTKSIYRSYIMSEELKNIIWGEMICEDNYLILHIYPHEVEKPHYDKLGNFIRPNSIDKFEKYVETNTPIFTFNLDTESFYGWIELMGIYHAIKEQEDYLIRTQICENLDNKKYWLKLKASVE